MPTMVHLSVHLPATESPTTVELAFQRANNGTSQIQLTYYRRSNGAGVSRLTFQQWYSSVPTYRLQKVQRP